MKLQLPLLMEHLERRDIMVSGPNFYPEIFEPKHRLRRIINDRFGSKLHGAQKFIFDSGSDTDPETTDAFRETALNMMEAGFFHLPFPVTWIEDPFTEPDGMLGDAAARNLYLCIEHPDAIEVWFANSMPGGFGTTLGKNAPKFNVLAAPLIMDLKNPTDKFTMETTTPNIVPEIQQAAAEAIYSIKKFIVSMAIADTVRERSEGKPYKASLPKKFREYPYTIIRIPEDHVERSPSDGALGTGRKRRRHLVRGYMWGKHTRPVDQQRWIFPCWRGSQEVAEVVVERGHYEVKARSKAQVQASKYR